MRIIAGIHRSRIILPPRNEGTTRPITDRVKQTLFDRLVNRQVLDGPALDIFSGTGSLGLEALSRGVDHCTFIERDRSAREVLQKNLDNLRLTPQATVLSVDALGGGWINALPRKPVQLIFCDPPYRMTQDPDAMPRLLDLIHRLAEVATTDGVLVLRTEQHIAVPPVEGWLGPESRNYGSMTLHFYDRDENDASP